MDAIVTQSPLDDISVVPGECPEVIHTREPQRVLGCAQVSDPTEATAVLGSLERRQGIVRGGRPADAAGRTGENEVVTVPALD
ncbi:hypothetical protein, partial [Pseudomonas indica]|uniref:hypothetical protein n=1 Tax=Pseudomonas indica TaxID=137658 RepID=UPI0023F7BE4C